MPLHEDKQTTRNNKKEFFACVNGVWLFIFGFCCRFDGVQIGIVVSLLCSKLIKLFKLCENDHNFRFFLFTLVECFALFRIFCCRPLLPHSESSRIYCLFFFYIIKTTNEQTQKVQELLSLWIAKSSSSSSTQVDSYFRDFQQRHHRWIKGISTILAMKKNLLRWASERFAIKISEPFFSPFTRN